MKKNFNRNPDGSNQWKLRTDEEIQKIINKYPKFWDESSWEETGLEHPDYTGLVMSYGCGPRFIFLGFPWQLDFAWQYNPHKGTISQRKWYLSIGLDF